MRFNIYKEIKISLFLLLIVLIVSLLFYFFASIFTSMGYSALRTKDVVSDSTKCELRPIIIIDPGHGGEDPGAVDNNLIEKDLNLEISNLINEILLLNGYSTVMTRTDDRLLYNFGEENRKKYYDLRNREILANNFSNAISISVHMNKFSSGICKGFQTFYTDKNEHSKIFAQTLQDNILALQPSNHRKIINTENSIYLLSNIKHPSVLVECGFISNTEEARLFMSSEYKTSLAISIYCGIAEYLET